MNQLASLCLVLLLFCVAHVEPTFHKLKALKHQLLFGGLNSGGGGGGGSCQNCGYSHGGYRGGYSGYNGHSGYNRYGNGHYASEGYSSDGGYGHGGGIGANVQIYAVKVPVATVSYSGHGGGSYGNGYSGHGGANYNTYNAGDAGYGGGHGASGYYSNSKSYSASSTGGWNSGGNYGAAGNYRCSTCGEKTYSVGSSPHVNYASSQGSGSYAGAW